MRLAILFIVLTIPRFAGAQMVVNDPSNLAQNIQQVLQNAQQIAATVKLVEAEAKHLASLPENLRGRFDRDLDQLSAVLRQAEGLSYQMERISADFDKLYGTGGSAADLTARLQRWRAATREATRTALVAQGILGAQERASIGLERLIAASRAAPGSLAATQAANEIAARQVVSLMRLQELNATFQRAVTVREAERQASEAAAQRRYERQVESLKVLKGM